MSDDVWFMKAPCKHCPFRRDVTPFLHPARAEEIAGLTWNRYNDFPCHKTTVEDEDSDFGDMRRGPDSLLCAGFLAMQVSESGMECPDGFTPSDLVYSDPYEMEQAYLEEWERQHGPYEPEDEDDEEYA